MKEYIALVSQSRARLRSACADPWQSYSRDGMCNQAGQAVKL